MASSSNDDKSIAIVGLGLMGEALAKFYGEEERGFQVHGWNRGADRREAVAAKNYPNVTIHADLVEAIKASKIILLIITGDKNMQLARALVKSVPTDTWSGKTIMNFVTHEPMAAALLEKDLLEMPDPPHHVGGAIIGVPDTFGTPACLLTISAPARSNARSNQELQTSIAPAMQSLGRLEVFEGDLGYGALIDVALILALDFGMTGFELSHLVIQRYQKWINEQEGRSTTDEKTDELLDRFLAMSNELFPIYFPHFFGIVSKSIRSEKWEENYITASSSRAIVEMYTDLLDKLGFREDNIVAAYLKPLGEAAAANPKNGVSTWIQHFDKK